MSVFFTRRGTPPYLPLPPAVLDLFGGTSSDIQSTVNGIAYGNGYWVAVGQYYNNGQYYARIAYATSLEGPWTTKDLWYGSSINGNNLKCVAYANGYWVVGGVRNPSTGYECCTAWAHSPDGEWTINPVYTSGYTVAGNGVKGVAYADGHWVVAVLYSTSSTNRSASIAYTTIPSNPWTKKRIWYSTSSGTDITCVAYGNGYWVVGGSNETSSGETRAYVGYSRTLNSSFSIKNLDVAGYKVTSVANGTCTANGINYWVAGVSNSSGSNAKIYHCTDISTNNWERDDIWETDGRTKGTSCVAFTNGYFVMAGDYYDRSVGGYRSRIAYALSPIHPKTFINIGVPTGANKYQSINCITYADGYWVLGGHHFTNNAYWANIIYSPTLEGFNDIDWGGDIPPATTISFTIDGIYYNAEEGMTWYEWANSSYNITDYTCAGDNEKIKSGISYIHYDNTAQYGKDIIVADRAYRSTNEPGGGEVVIPP